MFAYKQPLKSLSKVKHLNGFKYVLLFRTQQVAFYAQYENERIVAYEVFKVKIRKWKDENGELHFYEGFPRDEDIGYIGKSFRNFDDARQYFNNLKSIINKEY